MFVVSVSQCYVTTIELQACNEDISLYEVTVTFTGKFDKAPFLSIREGNIRLDDLKIELTAVSSTAKETVEEIAKRTIELSSVLSSFKEPIELVIKKKGGINLIVY